jgi:hypothetical protein
MLFNRDSTIQKCSRDFTLFSSQRFRFPASQTLICPQFQPSGRRTIPFGRPRDQSIIRLYDMDFRPDTHLYREASVLACIHPDVSAARPDDSQWSSFRFSFQVQIREDCCNHQDDVDSRPDALTHKARIAIQTQSSGRQSAMVWTRAQQIWKLCVEDQPSGRPSPMVRTREAFYGNYLQRTCDRPDAALKHERFLAKISEFWSHSCPSGRPMSTFRTAPVYIKAIAHLNPQPISKGPLALRTARIRYWIPLELKELFCEVIERLFSLKPPLCVLLLSLNWSLS